ncbi:MAG TPA: amino acid ABC transporter substrate-binding protein [Streptosporangiaceae bacterium]|nr:amino acid ABC transporter substrate-binding protein [Streptosporangiaceae bacterium]
MRPNGTRFLALTAIATISAMVVAACSSSTTTTSSSGSASKSPILIGTSLSLTGDFSVDGQAFERGYNLWVKEINKSGGLLGHKVTLKIVNDNSDPGTVTTNYTQLISADHAAFVFGPFSTLLTAPAAQVAARYHYAFIEGAGGGPLVFSLKLPNLFAVSPVVADQLIPFANWVASLPASQRPKTAAYPMVTDPFAVPMVQNAQAILQKAGVKTVYSKIFPAENPAYKAGADQIAHLKPDMVVIGSPDVPGVQSVMQAFMQQHYTPKILAASAGPDQGAAFLSAVGGSKNATGTMVPNGWYPGFANPLSQAFVKNYNATYGGTPADINADAAEAYSVGETLAAAVAATKSLSNAKVISYLHSGVTVQTVQGPAKFNAIGENIVAQHFIFQWQTGAKFVQVLPTNATGSVAIVNPKPAWGQG